MYFFVTVQPPADYISENDPETLEMEVNIMKTKRMISSILSIAVLASFAGCTAATSDTAPATGTKEGAASAPTNTIETPDERVADSYGSTEGLTDREATGEAELGKSDIKGMDSMSIAGEPAMEAAEGDYDTDYGTDHGDAAGADDTQNGIELPEAGQLTAGEWNDNANWGFFTNLVTTNKIAFPSFGLDPTGRIMITVKDASGNPTANVNAVLTDESGKTLWSAVTDNMGRAYLFGGDSAKSVVLSRGSDSETYPVELKTEEIKPESDDQNDGQNNDRKKTQETDQTVRTAGVTEMELTFSPGGKKTEEAQIMFIVDATGSMSDEMLFLQSEFTAITSEIGTDNTSYSVNFYRDKGDTYVTKCNDFTTDIAQLQNLLNKERADGGGDTPEAVAQILDETMNMKSWKEDAVKLAFLIFDAPPHLDEIEQLDAAIAVAAEKGIRIIPVVSSNSDRETELFGRAAAIMTGGTYVFLTDDSGIGESHLEPIIGSYEVEKLYDIIIRVINDYRK